MNTRKIWKEFEEHIEEALPSHIKEREKLHFILLKYSRQGSKVLDIGCGAGIESILLLKNKRNVIATDLSSDALNLAKKLSKKFKVNLITKKTSATKLPFKNNTFDLVFSSAVLHYLSKKEFFESLKEQKRVLKKGGKLLIDVPYKYSLHTFYKKYKIKNKNWIWGNEREFSISQIKKAGENLGLRHIEKYSWGLDRFFKALAGLDQTKYKKQIPKLYSKITYPLKKTIEFVIPVNIGLVFEKQ